MRRAVGWSLAVVLASVAPARAQISITERREQPIPGPVLALAWTDETRLLVLGSRQVSLVAWRAGASQRLDVLDLRVGSGKARVEAGLLVPGDDGTTAWLTTNRLDHSLLVAIDGERLSLRSEALALPWPGSAGGLRYEEGTNVLSGVPPAWAGTPLLALTPGTPDLAVGTGGELLALTAEGPRPAGALRVGPTLAPLAAGLLAVSSARPPGAGDEVTILRRDPGGWLSVAGFPVDGAVRAVAAHVTGRSFRLACAAAPAGRLPWRLVVAEGRFALP